MSDETKDETVEEPVAVDYSTMTDAQLEAKQTILETKRADLRLKATAGEATQGDTEEFNAAGAELVKVKEARAAISAMLIDDEPAPVAEPLAPVAEANVEPTPEPQDQVIEQEVVEEPVLVAADIDTDKLTGTGPVEDTEPEAKPAGTAIMASIEGRPFEDRQSFEAEPTSFQAVADRVRGMKSSFQRSGLLPKRYVMSVDHFANTADTPRAMAGDSREAIAFNSALVTGKLESEYPVLADCRNPIEFETEENCSYRADTPFWDIFNRNVDANACSFKWDRDYVLEDFPGAIAYWDACRQALVDGADEATWKPLAEMPACQDDCYSTAEAFYLTQGLRVTVDDEFCRPERIREANEIINALRAIEIDFIARSNFDAHAARGGNVYAANLNAFGTDLGFRNAFEIAVMQLVNRFNYTGRFTCSESSRFAEVPEYLVKHMAIDLSLAGEQASAARQVISDAFAICGITDVIFTDDYGSEGNLSGRPEEANDGERELCIDWNCTDNPFSGLAGQLPAFGSGSAPLPLTDRARLRIGHRNGFAKGSTGVVDYDLRRDNDNLRQNEAEYFGESRHFFFPIGTELESGIFDLTNICPNGNRVDRTAAIDCAAIVAAP